MNWVENCKIQIYVQGCRYLKENKTIKFIEKNKMSVSAWKKKQSNTEPKIEQDLMR